MSTSTAIAQIPGYAVSTLECLKYNDPLSAEHFIELIIRVAQNASEETAALERMLEIAESRLRLVASASGKDPDEYIDEMHESATIFEPIEELVA